MIYDLAQPHYNHAPQFPGQPPKSVKLLNTSPEVSLLL